MFFQITQLSVINECKTLRILRVSSLSLFTQAQLLVDRWIRAEILAAELSESDPLSCIYLFTCVRSCCCRMLLAWLLWTPVTVCHNLVWRYTMDKQYELSSELHRTAIQQLALRSATALLEIYLCN